MNKNESTSISLISAPSTINIMNYLYDLGMLSVVVGGWYLVVKWYMRDSELLREFL